jgi:hypothetical protein
MADINRVRVLWTGMPGAPGVSTHYLGVGVAAADLTAIRTFYNALITGLPNTLTLTVLGTGDKVDDETGELTGSWSATAPTIVNGWPSSCMVCPRTSGRLPNCRCQKP